MLNDLEFKDIYLGNANAWFSGVPNTFDPVPAPQECASELSSLREMCEKTSVDSTREEFPVRFENVAYRASVLQSIAEKVFVLRRFPKEVPTLNKLNLFQGYIDLLMKPKLSGLVIIAGTYGQGKTHTASSLISGRLSALGGVAVTIEDPPEMPLEGKHGEGVCYQTWIEKGGFGEACRKAARWAPSMIFLGEVRDSESAAEALRASLNGRLVICTTHAESVSIAIERMYHLALGAVGGAEDTGSLLANALLCVLHQKLEGEPKSPKQEFLWMGDEESAVGVRNNIKQRKFDQIANEVNRQHNVMIFNRARDQKTASMAAQEGERRNTPRD